MITFLCRDCDAAVTAVVLDAPPDDYRCLTCHFLAKHVPDPIEREILRRLFTMEDQANEPA